LQWSDARKIYNTNVGDRPWSAIQVTTAAGVCAAVDMHVAGLLPSSGFVKQEQIDFDKFMANRFGRRYESKLVTRFSQAVKEMPVISEVDGVADGESDASNS
jgi:saccharopine dehydrogenase-like NADP-dependent oxidoreductase